MSEEDRQYARYASVESQPPPPPEPAKVVIRNTEGYPGLILSEPEAEELYLLLKEYFEGA
jgi:hypothetical protein